MADESVISFKIDENEENNQYSEPVSWKDIRPQIFFSTIAFLLTTQAGINMAYPNLLLQEIDTTTASWIRMISTPLGALLTGPLADKFGRKNCHLMIGVPCIISWLLFAFADTKRHLYILLIGRVLGGMASGLCAVTLVYVSEITHKNFRPMLLSMLSIHVSVGILVTTAIGKFLTWKITAIIFVGCFTIITTVIHVNIVESPQWLLNFVPNSEQKAMKNLELLNPNKKIFKEECTQIYQNRKRSTNSAATDSSKWKITEPEIYKPVIILMILIFLLQLSGLYQVLLYAKKVVPIVGGEIGEKLNGEMFLVLGIIRFSTTIIMFLLSKRIGRRPLLMFSTFAIAVCCFLLVILLGICNKKTPCDDNHRKNGMLPLFVLCCYTFLSGIGPMTIPWTMIAELLPVLVKGIGMSFMISYSYVLLSIVTLVFPHLLDSIHIGYIFLSFGLCSLCMSMFTYFFLPETLGKSMYDIEQYFRR